MNQIRKQTTNKKDFEDDDRDGGHLPEERAEGTLLTSQLDYATNW